MGISTLLVMPAVAALSIAEILLPPKPFPFESLSPPTHPSNLVFMREVVLDGQMFGVVVTVSLWRSPSFNSRIRGLSSPALSRRLGVDWPH